MSSSTTGKSLSSPKELEGRLQWTLSLESPYLILSILILGRCNNRSKSLKLKREDRSWMRLCVSRYVTWEMGVGTTITSQLRSKRGSIDHLKSSLGPSMTHLQTSGPSLVWYLKWQQVTFCLSQKKGRALIKMTTTWLKWWNCLGGCPKI